MNKNNMKNMIILKNLPSNIVEEAIVVLKENKNAKNLQYIDKLPELENTNKIKNSSSKDYIVKEAEMLINSYIDTIEKQKIIRNNFNVMLKYKKLKIITIFFGSMLFIDLLIRLFH